MNILGDFLGEVCKIIFPISEEVYLGNPKSSISICTLSSILLLKNIANSDLMKEINLVGRLFSENKGIDSIIRYVNSNQNIKILIVCGKEVFGHKSGNSLLDLYNNGINNDGRIINSSSPDPTLTVTQNEVEKFRHKIKLINKIGITNLKEITKLVKSIKN
jgi:tetrahydromethanopterin S-methyltransferase subunit A